MKITSVTLFFLIVFAIGCDQERESERPHIILIMADDMGFSDIGCYGSEIHTPNIDALADGGVRFSQFYNGARCCPTRASLLTGLYAHQTGMGEMEPDRGLPGYRGNINQQCVTMGEALGVNGYRTYMSGKWHLTRNVDPPDSAGKFNWPNQRGFDHFFGTIAGAGNFWNPRTLTEDNRSLDPKDFDDFYYTDAITDKAVEYINSHNAEEPMFMYVAYTAPHWPLMAKEDDIARYRDVYSQGWDKIREQRYQKMLTLGIIDSTVGLSPRDERVMAWDSIEVNQLPREIKENVTDADHFRNLMTEKMATYAAMVDCMDQGVGKIIASLKAKGIRDNTLIVFLSDNGGCDEWGTYGFGWNNYAETGEIAGTATSNTSYGPAWAHVSNTPFRYYKLYTYEGGIATPFIMNWPATIQPQQEVIREVSHIIDVMPTFMDASRSTYPETFQDHAIQPMQGASLMPLVMDGQSIQERPIYWEHITGKGIRLGKWKLMTQRRTTDWQLYDMENDRAELHNLADQYPEKVKELASMWDKWAKEHNVYPYPDVFKEWLEE